MAKIKGADGKECWDGYRYAGTENGKDKCIKVDEMKEITICNKCALELMSDIKEGKVSTLHGTMLRTAHF